MRLLIYTVVFSVLTGWCHSLNILVVWNNVGGSHFRAFEELFKTLAVKGHNLTMVSYFPQQEPITNYRDVNLVHDESFKIIPGLLKFDQSIINRIQMYSESHLLAKITDIMCKNFLTNPSIKNLITEKSSYDVMLTEIFTTNCHHGLIKAMEYKGPVVGMNLLTCSTLSKTVQ